MVILDNNGTLMLKQTNSNETIRNKEHCAYPVVARSEAWALGARPLDSGYAHRLGHE